MKKLKFCFCMACLAAMSCFILTGCGNRNSTSGNNTQASTNDKASTSENAGNAVGDAIGDVGNAVGDAVGDVANGVGDAVGDITSGFTNYGDAHDYFMDRMGKDNPNSQYELRNESKDLTTYDGSTQGYHFELYDTAVNSDGEKVGDFYLEPKSGRVYKKDASGKFNEYQFKGAANEDNTNTNTAN